MHGMRPMYEIALTLGTFDCLKRMEGGESVASFDP